MDMRRTIPAPLLADMSAFVAAHMGLHFPPERWRDLENGIAATAGDLKLADAETCARAILSTPPTHSRIQVLASHLTIGETYFFREKNSFAALEEHILPELLRARRGAERRLRIWCAGCCTGEEPYSVAMLLDRLIPAAEEWNVTILGTDINPHFLRKAEQGVYSEWSFRNTPEWMRERYFKALRDGRFELHPRIRKRVTFSHLNLADDAYPSFQSNTHAIDVILCRNVLMYFTAERARQVAANFHHALAAGGWLMVSPCETSNVLFSPLSAVQFPGAMLYRKTEDPVPPLVYAVPMPSTFGVPDSQEPGVPTTALPEEPMTVESATERSQTAENPAEFVRAARICANDGRLDEASQMCEKAIAADRLNPAHYYLLATIRQEQGQLDSVAQALTRAVYVDADFALAHFALGNLRRSQGRYRETERHFSNALSVLSACAQDDILPESDGLTAGRLATIIAAALANLPHATA